MTAKAPPLAAVMERVESHYGLNAISDWLARRKSDGPSQGEHSFRDDPDCLLELRGAVDDVRIREQVSIKVACRRLVDRGFAIHAHAGPIHRIENGKWVSVNDEVQTWTWPFQSAEYLEAEYKRAKSLLAKKHPVTFQYHEAAVMRHEADLGLTRKKRGRPKKEK